MDIYKEYDLAEYVLAIQKKIEWENFMVFMAFHSIMNLFLQINWSHSIIYAGAYKSAVWVCSHATTIFIAISHFSLWKFSHSESSVIHWQAYTERRYKLVAIL